MKYVPEESISTPGQNDDALGRLERRIESLEFAAQREDRWWRGGLIAALVLVALSILIAGHHRHHHPPPMTGMRGCEGQRMMPYGPPPPPYSPVAEREVRPVAALLRQTSPGDGDRLVRDGRDVLGSPERRRLTREAP